MTLAELRELYERACARVTETAAAVAALPANAALHQVQAAADANDRACDEADEAKRALDEAERQLAIRRGRDAHPAPTRGRPDGAFGESGDGFGRALMDGLEEVITGRSAAAYIDPATAMRTDREQRAILETAAPGVMVPMQLNGAVFTLRASSIVLGLPGIHILPMESDRMRFPRIAGVDAAGNDLAYSGIQEVTSITESTPDVDAVDLVAAKFGVYHTLSTEFVEDATGDALALFAQNMMIQLGLKVDYAMLQGGGTDLVGIRNTIGISTTSVAGLPADFDKLTDTVYAAEAANAHPAVWIMHPRSWAVLSKIKTGLSGDKTTLLEPDPEITANTLLGLQVRKSTQISLTEGAATAGSWVAAVDSSQLVVGVRRAPLFEISRDAAFQSDAIAIKVTARYAFGVLNPAGISIATDVRAS